MADKYHTDIRLQLAALGYRILPNKGKVPPFKDWHTEAFPPREMPRIARWPLVHPECFSTGLRAELGLAMIDGDVNDEAGAAALLDDIGIIAPEVAARAPTRYSEGTSKFMLFCRLDPAELHHFAKTVVTGRSFYRPGEEDSDDDHKVEIFTGKLTAKGTCRQVAILGPRDATSSYVWDDGRPLLWETPPADLPLITAKQCFAIIDAFERWAAAAGWTLAVTPNIGAATVVYDITDETRFDTDAAGNGLTYAELCDAFAVHEALRCTTTFIAGKHGTKFKCVVGDKNRHACVAVYVHGDGQVHYPQELDPERIAEGLREGLRGFADEHPEIPVPPPIPLWREKYKKSPLPRPSFHNAKLAILAVKLVCSEDTLHRKMFIGRGEAGGREPLPPFVGEVTDANISMLRGYLSDVYQFDLTEKHLRDAVENLAHENRFNPVVDMLAEAEANWDGAERLDRMAIEHFNCADNDLNRQCVRKTMVAAVTRARIPGCKFDTIPVLEAREGWNKSTAWAVLAGEGNFSDEKILGKPNREVQEQLAGVWIYEIADLAGMRKTEVETIKGFASQVEDRARPAYGHYLVVQPRAGIMAGTTNGDRYLQSQTGNRRFWPLKVEGPIDIPLLRAKRLQLWGEAAHRQKQGEGLTLDPSLWPAAAIEQEARRALHGWEEILTGLDYVPAYVAGCELIAGVGEKGLNVVHHIDGEDRVSTKALFEHALKVPAGNLHRGHVATLAEVMRALGWQNKKIWVNKEAVGGYFRPSRKVSE